MPKATLVTMTVLASLVLALGCRKRPVEDPARETIHRSTTILRVSPRVEEVEPAQRSRPAPTAPAPAMSVPPVEEALDAPAPAPDPPPTEPVPQPPSYRDRCGRPLVA